MRILSTLGLVFYVLFSMVGAGYSVCEGDLNCDGVTDGSDLVQFAADFGTTGCGTCDDVITRIDELRSGLCQLYGHLELPIPDFCPVLLKRVFITRFSLSGDLRFGEADAITGADQKCTELATAAGLPGTYMAWLSIGDVNPDSRFIKSPSPYIRIDNEVIANDWQDLTDGTLINPINIDEYGYVTTSSVHSNTTIDGLTVRTTDTLTCNSFTSESGSANPTGNPSAIDATWTNRNFTISCMSGRLYCFEQ